MRRSGKQLSLSSVSSLAYKPGTFHYESKESKCCSTLSSLTSRLHLALPYPRGLLAVVTECSLLLVSFTGSHIWFRVTQVQEYIKHVHVDTDHLKGPCVSVNLKCVIISIPQCFGTSGFQGRARTIKRSYTVTTYIVTQGPEARHDLYAAWSRDLHTTQLYKPLCAKLDKPAPCSLPAPTSSGLFTSLSQ